MSTGRFYLVTGGTGFIGSALVRRMVSDGYRVRVLDNNSRGAFSRLDDIAKKIEMIDGDIRDAATVSRATRGVDGVAHLAYINGTEFFYSIPERILEVAVKGIMNIVDACLEHGVGELCLASSSEVYQTPPKVPTAEDAPLSVPNPLNPRFSYGGGKIISELIALNYGQKHFKRVTVFRPHNVYGPNMGREHVVPQFVLRLRKLMAAQKSGVIDFPIQGDGKETRAFAFIDDAIDGIMRVLERGEHRNIYHVGTDVETRISALAEEVAKCLGREIRIVPGQIQPGSTLRRCPDIGKLRGLGFEPRVKLCDGLSKTVEWYSKLEI